MKQKPLVSIIIPTYNEEKNIERALKSIQGQSYNNIEIIIVDKNSIDKTVNLAKDYTSSIYFKGPERSSQKNYGSKKATGEFILFLDADATLTVNVIKECVILGKNGVDMVIIPEINVGIGYWANVKAFERSLYLGNDEIEAPWFFRKSSFMRVNGYDENMYAGEDWDLFERMKTMGLKYARCDANTFHHLGNPTFSSLTKKKYYYGKNLKFYINKNNFIKKYHL